MACPDLRVLAAIAVVGGFVPSPAAIAATPPVSAVVLADNAMHGGQLDVSLNKSQVLTVDRTFAKALIGNDEIADVLPMTDRSLYVLGKKMGTTSLTLYDSRNMLIAVIDIAVGPDVLSLKRQLAELMPKENISARISNDAVVLSGIVSSAPAIDRALQVAKSFAGDKVINMMSVGSAQQVMLEVRFSEMDRSAAKQIGFNTAFLSNNGKVQGGIGSTAPSTALLTNQNGVPTINIAGILDAFGVGALAQSIGGLNIFTALDALERKGVVHTLAEPTLVALSGETASFLAGGEFPVPVSQGTTTGGGSAITVEFKPFGVSLAFTPTVLEDGIINLVVAPEVSSIDPSASVTVNGLTIPGLQTRRANTTLELRDGQSFAIAGLMRNDFSDTVRQFPILGSIPIIGALFRSTGFQKSQTELVIIVTPRLVQPINPRDVRLPTDRVAPPSEMDLFLLGKTENVGGTPPADPSAKPEAKPRLTGPNGYEF